jgi:V/A-type H+-transporting ATPase subunit A
MPEKRVGHITKINGNMVTVKMPAFVVQNEVAYILHGEEHLKSEVIRVRGRFAELQVYENTIGVKIGEKVEFSDELLSVELGPGLLGQIFDGLPNPLPHLAETHGFFLKRGSYLEALPDDAEWGFTPEAKPGIKLRAGEKLGFVREKLFNHYIMVPFHLQGILELVDIAAQGQYNLKQPVARLKDEKGAVHKAFLQQIWPVKIPIRAYAERLKPAQPLISKMRIIDSLFPVVRGGTYCIPGPFGAGKTVLQQLTSRHADVDIVIIAACGERAGEVVETLKTFPEIKDPGTGRPLSDRTVIICNTSSMPVAARESSVYTAVTIAEYYRQMGLNVLLLADSTSRWAQAMREMSGRLEEIPGEEAFPAYLETRIASFYERAGSVRLYDGTFGSVTIGGTVSPAGGNFEEPVTQATLKVVGEEGTSLQDYIDYLKGEFFDFIYLQQNAYDEVDQATTEERQKYITGFIYNILQARFDFENKDEALKFFQRLRQLFRGWNSMEFNTSEFLKNEQELSSVIEEISKRSPAS